MMKIVWSETPRDSTKPRIAPYKSTWKRLQNIAFWCNLKLAEEKGLLFYRTRSHAVVLYNTLPAASFEKAVCMKTQDKLYQKVRLTPRLPRVVFRSNTQCGVDPSLQDNVRCRVTSKSTSTTRERSRNAFNHQQ